MIKTNKLKDIKLQAEKIAYQKAEDLIKDLPKTIEEIVKGSIFSLLGISKGWNGDHEIDHCNGRNSILTDIIKNKAREDVEKFVKDIGVGGDIKKKIKSAFNKEYEDQLRYAVKYEAERLAKDSIKGIISNEVERIKRDLDIEKK